MKFHAVEAVAGGVVAPVTPDTLVAFNRLIEPAPR